MVECATFRIPNSPLPAEKKKQLQILRINNTLYTHSLFAYNNIDIFYIKSAMVKKPQYNGFFLNGGERGAGGKKFLVCEVL